MDVVAVVEAAVEAACTADVPGELEDVRRQAVALEQAAGRLRARASELLGEVVAHEPDGAAWWWRDALGITGEAAGHAVRRAAGLRSLPVLSSAARDGVLSLEQAGAFVPLVGKVDAGELTEMQQSLVEGGRRRTVDSIQQWVRVLLATHAEEEPEISHEEALKRRFLKHRISADGMVRGTFAMTAEDGEAFLSVLEPLARREGDADERSVAQRRSDAMTAVFEGAARWMDLPHAGGQRAQISYVISCGWAAGLREADPARGAWTGPQTRARMEAMLCESRLTRVLLDAEGQVASLESVGDEITLAQRRAVSARDQGCVARGCTRPPAFCDVHHLVSRKDGGPTSVDNLVLLCRRHHVMWHEGRVLLPDLEVPWLRKPLDPPMVA